MNSFEISFDEKLNIVRATVVGVMMQADGENVITTTRKAAAEKSCNIIYDIRQATTKVAFAEQNGIICRENWMFSNKRIPVR